MIQIVPAIDLIGGRCVRLTMGEYSSKKEYGASPLDAAMAFADCGVRRVHMVDLDGAKAGHPVNLGVLEEVSSNVSCEIEWGGGISDAAALESVFSAGASHAIIGSRSLTNAPQRQNWSLRDKRPPSQTIFQGVNEGKKSLDKLFHQLLEVPCRCGKHGVDG